MYILRIVGAVIVLVFCCVPTSAATVTREPLAVSAHSRTYGSAYFKIKVPAPLKAPPSFRGIRPLYISPSTKSISVDLDGSRAVTANVDPATGFAAAVVHATVGRHLFTVDAYDEFNGEGAILSSGSIDGDIPNGYIRFHLTLGGVVASVALALDYPNATVGSPAVINLNLTAKDPDGNIILAPDTPFAQPITLTSSDPVNGKLSFTTIEKIPDIHSRLSVAYSGANVRQILFSATGGGLAPKAVTPAILAPLSPPASGGQLIAQQDDDPVAAFSTLPAHQLLGTLQKTHGYNPYAYGSVAVDDVKRLIYIVDNFHPHERIDIFAATGAHPLVDTIAAPLQRFGGLAVDSSGGKIFSAQFDYTSGSTDIHVYSTAPGHALLAKFAGIARDTPALAVDSAGGRLYAAPCCSAGLYVFSTAAPYPLLASYGTGPSGVAYCDVAVDPVTRRVFLSECNPFTQDPSYVDVYEAADLKHRAARIAPLTPGENLAIDAKARVLYVASVRGKPGLANGIAAFGLDDGYAFLGSFPVRSVDDIAVVPFAP